MRKILFLVLVAGAIGLGATGVQAQCPEDVGEALGAACPCGADAEGQAWKNHGKYVSCVVRFRNELRKEGCLDAESKRTIARCAARSTCGKEGAVLCCVYDTSGTCDNDPLPGDGTAEGSCSNDAEISCDTATDCITVGDPKIKRSEDICTSHGGTAVGGGSVCAGCPALPPEL
jgi:hypothetical protein